MTGPVASLNTAWFALIGLLWTGYFVLEGFDFGVGMLSLAIGRDDVDRRLARNAIGPVWDGNEVWLIVAAGATFAAFPVWYASMFSGFYLALFIVLVALIVRGVSFEFRGKRDSAALAGRLGLGAGRGQPGPRLRLGGRVHRPGARPAPVTGQDSTWAASRGCCPGGGRRRAGEPGHVPRPRRHVSVAQDRRAAGRPGPPGSDVALPAGRRAGGRHGGLAGRRGRRGPGGLPGAVPVALAGGCAWPSPGPGCWSGRPGGLAFGLSALGIVAASAAVFTALFPRVMVSSGPGPSLTIWSAASAHRTLMVMTVVAAIFVPFVLAYQGWSYWVFRQRLTRPAGSASPSCSSRESATRR